MIEFLMGAVVGIMVMQAVMITMDFIIVNREEEV